LFDRGNEGCGAPHAAQLDSVTLAARLAMLPELPLPQLKQAWATAWGSPPPKGARRRFLMLGIAWRWQAQAHGGFSRATERRVAALEASFRQSRRIEAAGLNQGPRLMPGTRLVREWRGERHEVHMVEDGFIWRGTTHASLSAIARTITGARRNGPAFFGLRDGERSS
jgi:hypothetical protein